MCEDGGMSLRTFVVSAVVGACLAVPVVVVGVAAWSQERQAVEAQIDRGQQLAVTAATLQAVAQQSGSAADRAVLDQFLRAVVVGDVVYAVVADGADKVDFAEVKAGYGGVDGAAALLHDSKSGVVVVDAEVLARDRVSKDQRPAGRVVVGLQRAPFATVRVVAVVVAGLCVVALVAALLLWLFERRLVRPVQTVARALDGVAHGNVVDVEVPAAAAEIGALVDGYHALVKALSEKGALQASLARATGEQVDAAALDAPPVMRAVSVLFVDVRDFTPLTSALSPAQTVAFLDKLLSAFVDVVHRHGGHVERFLGDGLVAVWGAPRPAADHATRAVAAAVDLELRAATLSKRAKDDGLPVFVVGIGVASGDAVTGGVGPASRRFFAVTGEVPAMARRIQQEAKGQGLTVLVTEETFQACKEAAGKVEVGGLVDVVWRKTPPMLVRGVGMPLTLYRPQKGDQTDKIRR